MQRTFHPKLRVLGVDPGSGTTGYGVVDTDGRSHALVEYAAVRSPSRTASFADRLLLISKKLEDVIERLSPQVCSIEGAFYSLNVKSALKLGQVRGVVLVAAARSGLPVFEYSPLEIKSALAGYGRACKGQVQEMVRVILGLRELPEPHDASDALAVAICHIHNAFTLERYGTNHRPGERRDNVR